MSIRTSLSRPAATPMALNSLVKINTTTDLIEIAGATERPIGVVLSNVAQADVDDGILVGVVLLELSPTTIEGIADGAITAGAPVYCGAAGQLTATSAGNVAVGRLMPDSTIVGAAAGDIIEFIPNLTV